MKFEPELILKSPSLLLLISVSLLGWIASLIGSILAEISSLGWFALIYNLVVILFVAATIVTLNIRNYNISSMAYLSISFVFAVMAIQELLGQVKKSKPKSSADAAYAAIAGFALQAFSLFFWMILLGSMTVEESPDDSKKEREVSYNPVRANGLGNHLSSQPIGSGLDLRFSSSALGSSLPPIEYDHKAVAIYSYSAEDENELSFKKDEILDIAEIQGRWWSARHPNGSVGIVPSNYFQIMP